MLIPSIIRVPVYQNPIRHSARGSNRHRKTVIGAVMLHNPGLSHVIA